MLYTRVCHIHSCVAIRLCTDMRERAYMYVCMYVCIYIYIYTHVCAYTCVHLVFRRELASKCVYVYQCIGMHSQYIFLFSYVCMYVCIYIYIYTYVCAHTIDGTEAIPLLLLAITRHHGLGDLPELVEIIPTRLLNLQGPRQTIKHLLFTICFFAKITYWV